MTHVLVKFLWVLACAPQSNMEQKTSAAKLKISVYLAFYSSDLHYKEHFIPLCSIAPSRDKICGLNNRHIRQGKHIYLELSVIIELTKYYGRKLTHCSDDSLCDRPPGRHLENREENWELAVVFVVFLGLKIFLVSKQNNKELEIERSSFPAVKSQNNRGITLKGMPDRM